MTSEHQDFSPRWEYVADRVMGGVSNGGMRQETYRGRAATVLRGDVSLENNGGFVQIAFDLQDERAWLNAERWDGIEIDVCGNDEIYDLRLRTTQLSRPWQSFRTTFTATRDWSTLQVPFDAFEPHRTEAAFKPQELRRIGILGIGRVFRAEVAVARVGLYRTRAANR